MSEITRVESSNKVESALRFDIERGLWDTMIVPKMSGYTWRQVQENAINYLDWVLNNREYSADFINSFQPESENLPSSVTANPGNDQVESEVRDSMVVLRRDIAESASWRAYVIKRIQHDPDNVCTLFLETLSLPIFG